MSPVAGNFRRARQELHSAHSSSTSATGSRRCRHRRRLLSATPVGHDGACRYHQTSIPTSVWCRMLGWSMLLRGDMARAGQPEHPTMENSASMCNAVHKSAGARVSLLDSRDTGTLRFSCIPTCTHPQRPIEEVPLRVLGQQEAPDPIQLGCVAHAPISQI